MYRFKWGRPPAWKPIPASALKDAAAEVRQMLSVREKTGEVGTRKYYGSPR